VGEADADLPSPYSHPSLLLNTGLTNYWGLVRGNFQNASVAASVIVLSQSTVRAFLQDGYRVFAYVYDGKGDAVSVNVPGFEITIGRCSYRSKYISLWN